jgi:hypothetical protein
MIYWSLAAGLLGASGMIFGASCLAHAAQAAGDAASLDRPQWQVGDSWIIETLTEQLQGNEPKPAEKAPRIRWQFRVAKLEKVAGQDCYRVDIECLAQSRVRPKASVWCDKETLFLRQFETQVAFRGSYYTVQESYDCAKGAVAPVMASVNALPLGLPAFQPQGAKSLDGFTYTSAPLPAGVKDAGMIRFAHTVKQEVRAPSAKALKQVPQLYAKDIQAKPVTEVRLDDGKQSLTQVWQRGLPWPVYAENGRTQAWLVSSGTK